MTILLVNIPELQTFFVQILLRLWIWNSSQLLDHTDFGANRLKIIWRSRVQMVNDHLCVCHWIDLSHHELHHIILCLNFYDWIKICIHIDTKLQQVQNKFNSNSTVVLLSRNFSPIWASILLTFSCDSSWKWYPGTLPIHVGFPVPTQIMLLP